MKNNMFLFSLRLYVLLDIMYSKYTYFSAGFVTTCIYVMKYSDIYLYFPLQILHLPKLFPPQVSAHIP